MEEDLPCGNILWCPGDPGVGKTVITSNVIDHLLNLQGTRDIGVTYLYCDYHNEMNTTPTVLIGSLTRQLVQNQTLREFPNELFLEFSRARDGLSTLTVHEHLELFRSIAANISECYIVIDALDELENRHNATRSNMIAALKEISKDSVHVFITSRRFHEDINVAFHSALRIDITAKDEDIERFLRSKIKQNRDLQELFQEDGSLEDEIVKTILKKAGQQFLLPALHINRLADVTCIEEIKESLDDMATTLESTYDQAIARIQRQSHYRCALALNVLMMISFSKRPLRVAELREALAVKQNSSSISPGSLRTSKILLDVCIGLVIIEEKTDVIKLVHYTAYEYLRRSALFPAAEFEIAQRCLTYLQFDSFASGPQADARLYQARLETYPFFEYAASYFGHHAAALTMDVLQDELATLTLRFLRLPSNLASAIQAQFGTYNSRQPHKANYSVSASALWFAARFGLARIVRLLLQSGVDIDGKTFYGETALHEASSRGHLAIVQLLLDNGADINIPRGFIWQAEEFFNNQEKGTKELHKQLEGDLKITRHFGCPTCHRPSCQCLYFIKDNRVNSIASEISLDARLLKAAREGNETKALQLLASGADAKASDSIDRTILHWSVFSGLERLAHEALKRGCEVDAMDSAERAEQTALLEIARHPNGSPIIMKLLLQYGADANRRGNQWFGFCSPLHECVLRGDYEKALILLDYGANSKLKDYIGQEPIDIALRYKDMKMVTLLQEQEVASMYRETALHIAASKDHRDIVRLLLKMGADTRATTVNSETPLDWAASAGNSEILHLLLHADASLRDNAAGLTSPLHIAALRGHQSAVQILIQQGANINAMSAARRTPLHVAAKQGDIAMVKMLLDAGADLNAKAELGPSVFHGAAGRGHLAIMKLLLSKGADINLPHGRDGNSPLHRAVEKGRLEATRVLLAANAIVDLRDVDDNTPLIAAAADGRTDIVQLLLDSNSDPSISNRVGDTALHSAVRGKHLETVQCLVSRGSDVICGSKNTLQDLKVEGIAVDVEESGNLRFSAQRLQGHSPLTIAALRGYEDVLKLLLEGQSRTLLTTAFKMDLIQLAARCGHRGVVTLLQHKWSNTLAI